MVYVACLVEISNAGFLERIIGPASCRRQGNECEGAVLSFSDSIIIPMSSLFSFSWHLELAAISFLSFLLLGILVVAPGL